MQSVIAVLFIIIATVPSSAQTVQKMNTGSSGQSALKTLPADDVQTNPLLKADEYFSKGNFSHGIKLLEETELQTREKRTGAYLADRAVLLSHGYSALGHYQKALADVHKLLRLVENNGDPLYKAQLFNNLGDIYLCFGKIKLAIEYMKKGLDQARLSKNSLVIASILNNLGNVRTASKNYKGAVNAYQECLLLMQNSQKSSLKPKVLINLARVRYLGGYYQSALISAGDALTEIEQHPDNYNKAANLISLSLLAKKIHKYIKTPELLEIPGPARGQALETWLAQAARIGENIENNYIISCANGYLGQFYEEKGEYSYAMKLTRKAVFFAQQGYFPEILYRWQWQMGRLFRQEGKFERAAESYRKAIATLNPIRMEFFNGYRYQKKAFDENVRPLYIGLAELLLSQAEIFSHPKTGSQKSLEAISKLRQARDTIELLKKAELQDFFHDECLIPRKHQTAESAALSHTAVIYPIPLPKHLALLLMLPKGMELINVGVDSEYLGRTAKRFREQLEEGEEDFQNDATQLYDWLIRPAESKFASQNIDTLIIAPDGPLRLIPFSALHDTEHFLIEKYALGTVPAISLTDIGQTEREKAQVLLNGLSIAKQGFAPLKNVKKELQSVRAIMGGKILLNEEFTKKNLITELKNKDYDIIHMATHAVFGGSSQETFLLTYDDKLTMDGLEQIISLKKIQDKQLELLTLSACETAMGDERSAFGLAGVAIKAGAKSAIATLWPVGDEATYVAVNEFYRQISESGISKAKALQNAQKKLMSQAEYEHPESWAPFLLIGNWL